MHKTMMIFVSLSFLATATSAQVERRSPPVVIKSVGERVPRTNVPKPPPPPPLSTAAKEQFLKSLNLSGPGSLYVRLSSRANHVASRGFLTFLNASFVAGSDDSAGWNDPANAQPQGVAIYIKADAPGRRFLIDCAVDSNQKQIPFKLWQNNKLLQSFESTGYIGQHILFVLETKDDWWHEFTVTGGPMWYFYECEVTRLN